MRAVLLDLDGVIRHFDKAHVAGIERRHGLADGSLESFAFATPLITDVTTGRVSRAEWVERIGRHVGSPAAAAEWGVQPWTVDDDVLALADELRALGLTTAVLTNGTDTIADEVAASGIDAHVDAVFNSAEIGYVKPDARAFAHVLDALGLDAASVFFTDDSPSKLAGAAAIGMPTHLFTGSRALRAALRAAGVGVRG